LRHLARKHDLLLEFVADNHFDATKLTAFPNLAALKARWPRAYLLPS